MRIKLKLATTVASQPHYTETVIDTDKMRYGVVHAHGGQLSWDVLTDDMKSGKSMRTIRVDLIDDNYKDYEVPTSEVKDVMCDIARGLQQGVCWIRGDLYKSDKVVSVTVERDED